MVGLHRPLGVLLLAGVTVIASAGAAGAICGDGIIDPGEACDGTNLNNKDCTKVTGGFAESGQLRCNADCTFDRSDCERVYRASLVPSRGGPAKNRCHLEWIAGGTTAQRGHTSRQTCSEGDRTCDQDHQFNGVCTIAVGICLNVEDQRIPGCTAARIVRLDVMKPPLASPAGQDVAAGVLTAGQNLSRGAVIEGNAVRYSPAVTEWRCGSSTVRVPLRGEPGHQRPGKVTIKARTSDNTGKGRTTGSFTLQCLP